MMKKSLSLLIGLPLLTAMMGQGGCPGTIPTPPFLRPAPQIDLVNPSDSSLELSFSVNLGLYPDAWSLNWEFGDGSRTIGLSPNTGKFITHVYPANGNYTVKVYVFNSQALIGQGELPVVVQGPNRAPTASFTATPVPTSQPGVLPRTIAFDGTGSSDPDGSIVSYSWNFGDGSPTGSGATINHTYSNSGRFTATLTVTDNRGATGMTSQSVTANIPPTVAFTFSSLGPEAPELLTVNFDGSGSSDPDGGIATYAWNFGDNSPTGSGPTPQHTYPIQGTYSVTLTCFDNLGGSSSLTQSVPLLGTRPFIIQISPANGTVNTSVSITNLSGGNFQNGAGVRLTRNGQTDIPGSNVTVVNSGQITCNFDLNGAQLGDWNVVVRNPNADEATLTAGFRVVTPDIVRLTTSLGDIVLTLDPTHAPGHVANFLSYVDARKYDGIVFHRVPPNNFVIQSGAFESLGEDANPRLQEREGFPPIPSEANNGLSNIRGTIALALRGQDANSGSNQFFINVSDNTNLDTGPPPFTVFGAVTGGLSVVDTIAGVATSSAQVRLTNGTVTTFQDVPVQDVTLITARRE